MAGMKTLWRKLIFIFQSNGTLQYLQSNLFMVLQIFYRGPKIKVYFEVTFLQEICSSFLKFLFQWYSFSQQTAGTLQHMRAKLHLSCKVAKI